MKRLSALVVCVLPMLALTACGGATSSDNSVNNSVPSPGSSSTRNTIDGKGVNGTVPSSAKGETQNNVNELVNDINSLH